MGRKDEEAQEGAASLSWLESGMFRLHVEHQQMTPWSKNVTISFHFIPLRGQSEPSEPMLMLRRSKTSVIVLFSHHQPEGNTNLKATGV